MDVAHIGEFLRLSQNLNYSATAKELSITQSTLSKHISALEQELGARLFVRDSHSVRLTTAGRVFAERASGVLKSLEEAIDAVRDVNASISSTLSVAFIMAAPQRQIADACKLFRESAPDVRLSVCSMEPEEVVEALRDGIIDMGVTMVLTDSVPHDMVFNVMERERFGALVDRNHPVAGKESIEARDLAGETLLIPSPAAFPTIAQVTAQKLKEVFPGFNIVKETSSLGGIGPLIVANNYVALTYSCTTRFFTEGYSFVPLTDFDIKAAIGSLWKESRENASIDLMVKCLEKASVKTEVR